MDSSYSFDMRHSLSQNKVQGVVNHCIYMIATGKWKPGAKLPPVREAEKQWSVNRLTIVKGYRQLATIGLVENRTHAGFFVSGSQLMLQQFKHRNTLERLYEEFATKIAEDVSLSPLATFRYLAQLAEIKIREQEEVAFLECTESQAQGHASEIYKRLNMPILPLTLAQVDRNPRRIPNHIRTILVSMFHWQEARYLTSFEWRLVPITIQVAPELLSQFEKQPCRVVLLGSEGVHANHIAEDVSHYLGDIPFEVELPNQIEERLKELLIQDEDLAILLSPKLWGRLPPSLQKNSRVGLIKFQITESAWPIIVDSLGLPLGDLSQP